jgi:pyroglutamyl-peptidase
MKRVLVTGFEPFGHKKTNTSEAALKSLRGMEGVQTLVLPVEFGRAALMATEHAKYGDFDTVLSLGEKPGVRSAVHLEEQAQNRAFALAIPDNAGVRTMKKIDKQTRELWLPSTLDYAPLEDSLDELGIRHRRSRKAGQFVCNATLFGLLSAQKQGDVRSDVSIGFAHLAHMDADTAAEAVGRMAETLRDRADILKV